MRRRTSGISTKLGEMNGNHEVRVLDMGGRLDWNVRCAPRARRTKVYRNRHGRSRGGILVPAVLPRYRTRRERFDDLVVQEIRSLVSCYSPLTAIQFGVEDVPPSDPAPWEHDSVVLGRSFGADPRHNLPAQVVLYRLPLMARARTVDDLRDIIHAVVLEESSQLLGKHPEDIDPFWGG